MLILSLTQLFWQLAHMECTMHLSEIRKSIVKLHPHIQLPVLKCKEFECNSVGSAQGLFGTISYHMYRYTVIPVIPFESH